MADRIAGHLPLTEPTYYILLALTEALHGYAVMQKVEQLSHGAVIVGPGTLYGAFSTLERDGLIVKVAEVERRKSYALTALGRQVLLAQIGRLQIMVRRGGEVAARLKATGTR
jgi:DNA-binding PadR family transcriptional regulator